MEMEGSINNSGGMSRAAKKKRAAQTKKRLQHPQNEPTPTVDSSLPSSKGEPMLKKKKTNSSTKNRTTSGNSGIQGDRRSKRPTSREDDFDEDGGAVEEEINRLDKDCDSEEERSTKHHDSNEDLGNDDDDDDDQVDMKPAAAYTATEDEDPTAMIAARMTQLSEIVLLQGPDDDEDDDDNNYESQESLTTASNGESRTNAPIETNNNNNNTVSAVPQQQHQPTLSTTMTLPQRARCALAFLLQPAVTMPEFYSRYYEKQPLHVSWNGRANSKSTNGDDDDCDNSSRRQYKSRLDGFLSLESIQLAFEKNNSKTKNAESPLSIQYGCDINVTRYEHSPDGPRRVTLDPTPAAGASPPQALSADIWRHWNQGCTLRLLCPHKFSSSVHALLSLLEWEWGCMVGANAYLTPPGAAQGFAPHYDDIDAYCLQLQGRKRWKVYAPLDPTQQLPRTSSPDFTPSDLANVTPVMDVILEEGDVLYMPRGWIHQACTLPLEAKEEKSSSTTEAASASNNPTASSSASTTKHHQHSLHLTISAMQQWAWVDYLEILLPEALEAAAHSSTTLRQGLPTRFLDYMGAVHDNREEHIPAVLLPQQDTNNKNNTIKEQSEKPNPLFAAVEFDAQEIRLRQDEFRVQAKRRVLRVAKEAMDMLDAACDQMGKRFLSDRLPPIWSSAEKKITNRVEREQSSIAVHKRNKKRPVTASSKTQLEPDTLCRLVRPGLARLVLEQSMAVVYHCADNSVVYHDRELSPLEFELDDAPALEQLLTTVHPYWISVDDLIHDSVEDKVSVAQALYDEGILAIRSL